MRTAVLVTGVSGSGKSTVGALLATSLGAAFVEGDDLHPVGNRRKMAAGEPLTDEDRWPWLDRVADAITEADGPVVATCSALRRAYRDRLRSRVPDLWVLHLDGDRALLRARQEARRGHFMPASLMDSQLDTLEPLDVDESGARLDVAASPDAVVEQARIAFRGGRTP